MHAETDSTSAADAMPASADAAHEGHMASGSSGSALMLDQPMARDGSGTSWHPDASRVEGMHRTLGAWHTMLHGAAFVRYSAQDVFDAGRRGGQGFSMPNWVMGMGSRGLGARGQIALRAMFTAEPFTQGGAGYPLLFQTGETYRGTPLVDSQHPHDLFAELSVTVSRTLGRRAGVFGYIGFPGEPALGPPAFMHRPSARLLPDSPIGHHWQDATHVTFGVATAGFCYGPLKLDASLFTGREPDENRFDFDAPRFDSYSVRASLNVTDRWSIHVARGFIRGPEGHAPDEDLHRTTASVLYAAPLRGDGALSAALVWGYNAPAAAVHADAPGASHAHHTQQHALLGELDVSGRRQAVFGRLEFVQKGGGELALPTLASRTFWIGAVSAGTARTVADYGPFKLQAGAVATVNRVPQILQEFYGARPVSLQAYLRMSFL
ncbi:MAG: hypothetical protein R2834_15110 [Rhodothermales bacterium]